MQRVVSYNEREVRRGGSRDDIGRGYNVWVDLVDPSKDELQAVQKTFGLDEKALDQYHNKSKKPHVRFLNNQVFTIFLEMKNDDARTLSTEAVYMFHSEGWLVTIHSSNVDLAVTTRRLLEEKNRPLMETSIDALYYSILASIVDRYEQLLTAIELGVADIERKSVYRPNRNMLEYLDDITPQIIALRRHFWHIRDVINSLLHINEDKQDIKYLKIVYDNINQLIELVESYQDTVNSTRELYIANVSLQMNDTVKTLTVFATILLPLTFVTSLFGMNGLDLNNILSFPSGFFVVLGTMAVMIAALLIFLRAKRWILVREADPKPKPNNGKQKES